MNKPHKAKNSFPKGNEFSVKKPLMVEISGIEQLYPHRREVSIFNCFRGVHLLQAGLPAELYPHIYLAGWAIAVPSEYYITNFDGSCQQGN